MAVGISVRGDFKAVVADMKRVKRGPMRKAASQSLNTARRKVTTRIVRALSGAKNMPQKVIRGRVKFKAAKPEYLVTQIQGWWMPVSLIRLGKAKQNKKGVKVRGRSVLGAFIERSKFGHHMILKRAGGPRLPIGEQKEEIEAQADRTTSVLVRRMGAREFKKEFTRNMKRFLR